MNVSFSCIVCLTFETGTQSGTNRTSQQVGLISANILKIVNIKESYTLFRSKVSKCVTCSSASPNRGCTMEQLVGALRYKSKGCGFDWNLSLTLSFQGYYGPGVDSASD